VFQTTEYANVIIANTTTSNVLSSNTFTTVNLTSNNITSNTVNTKGIVVNSAYVGPFLGGAIVDYSTGNARVSVAGTDGINFYNGGQGSTLLATLSNGGVFTTSTVNTNSLTVNKLSSIHSIFESANVQASAAGSTMNIYLNSGSVFYYTANSTSNMTFNFVYDGVSTLNSTMPVGQAVSSAILVSQGATPYYPTTVQVDGVTITPKWLGASAPSTGDANTINSYSFSLIKTASATYTILASASKFA
jgi:hypothetical protein